MKKIKIFSTFLATVLFLTCLPFTATADAGVLINEANFPDENFREFISRKLDDGDGVLSSAEIASVKEISAFDYNLESLEGVKIFTNLTYLDCSFNPNIETLDLSGMTSLTTVDCGYSEIDSINLSGCTNLENLFCQSNNFTSLDLSGCPNLVQMNCHGCMLTSLNINGCNDLEYFDCGNNNLSSVDLTVLSKLWFLDVAANPLKNVNIGNNPVLCDYYQHSRTVETWYNTYTYYRYYNGNSSGLIVDPEDTVYGCTQRQPDPMPEFPAAEKDIGTFVLHAYMTALGRTADQAGFVNWVTNLELGKVCGAQLGYGFLFSQEYINKDRSNSEFVDDLYSVFFGRNRGDGEGDSWINELDAGVKDREQVFNGFVNSTEYYNLCKEYGVTAGYYVSGVPSAQQGGVNGFVSRLYRVCLGRLPDQGGQKNWVSNLISGGTTGASCVHGFLFSTEFTNKNLNDLDFVAYTYRAFFGREPDIGGLTTWMNYLGNGGTREGVFNGFVNSQEFRNLCSSYGITP